LPRDVALRAITLSPAEIFGVADQLGSLATGKEATFIVTDGDPLDVRTHVVRAFVRGRETSLESRQTRLWEKYRHRPRATQTAGGSASSRGAANKD
jgi:cytosine/adenosine deaminase-related metal-dependent hydrolase